MSKYIGHAPCGSPLPPRMDDQKHTLTIQTKFNIFMNERWTPAAANEDIEALLKKFDETYFVNMIFDGYTFDPRNYDENVQYIANLPTLEKREVDKWIEKINHAGGISRSTHI
ncbi:unnamed protein product [Didymodactylos carnosus]|uniref:Uncharacterized protein n=1 Tax=Didymodactylos carnosus TaxID=1234261 RepID=A0A813YBJ0_9BILA|nr:unnamed protein product [Didymodactylos carnosus]CAF1084174.1 unnamed protein product [Didymodactylos carnosus]CAF3667901.1 unnamed protein product [Didymodactylos carnosus]CAF3846821.1 unnamed protein product [Didymodactylos carnosus]